MSDRLADMSPQPLLMIEDDARLAAMVSDYLGQSGYSVQVCGSGAEGLASLEAAHPPPQLLILDLMLPDMDGLEICRRIRALPSVLAQTPVLMLTAKGDPMDRVIGLEIGADDYLAKPFEPRELLARIRSLLRRSHAPVAGSASALRQQLQFANWTLDCDAGHLIAADGMIVMLSSAELRLLKVFLDNPKRVLSRDQLLNHTQGSDAGALDRAIDIQVSRLRQKLNEDARSPQIIKTVRNGGYMLDVAVNPGVSSA